MREIDPSALTVAYMLAHGADEVVATCHQCGASWHAPVAMLPPRTTLTKIEAMMICPTCGSRVVEATPAWRGSPPTRH